MRKLLLTTGGALCVGALLLAVTGCATATSTPPPAAGVAQGLRLPSQPFRNSMQALNTFRFEVRDGCVAAIEQGTNSRVDVIFQPSWRTSLTGDTIAFRDASGVRLQANVGDWFDFGGGWQDPPIPTTWGTTLCPGAGNLLWVAGDEIRPHAKVR